MDKLQLLNDHPLPFAKVLGLKFVAASDTAVKAEMVVKPELCTRPEGKGTTTIESKTNFVGPAPVGTTVIGETTPIHRGRRTMVWQTRITTAEGKLVAVVTQTQMVL
jgi:1,4-dihydroxy-2-naphthoyl-CoA hydrolase